jgi:hypothetical protein
MKAQNQLSFDLFGKGMNNRRAQPAFTLQIKTPKYVHQLRLKCVQPSKKKL